MIPSGYPAINQKVMTFLETMFRLFDELQHIIINTAYDIAEDQNDEVNIRSFVAEGLWDPLRDPCLRRRTDSHQTSALQSPSIRFLS